MKPKLLYGNAIWSCCTNRILKMQKRTRSKVILNADRTTPSKTLFSSLKRIPFTDESFIRRSMIVYKRINASHNCPSYIDAMLMRNSDIHSRENRYSKINLLCPRFNRITEGGRTFAVRTIKDWNSIDVN